MIGKKILRSVCFFSSELEKKFIEAFQLNNKKEFFTRDVFIKFDHSSFSEIVKNHKGINHFLILFNKKTNGKIEL